jgi:DNA-binding protein HU-beta
MHKDWVDNPDVTCHTVAPVNATGGRHMTTASDIADKLATENNLSKSQAKTVVDGVFKAIADAAKGGDEVNVPGFGKFKVKATPAREGRNPASGQKIKIAASRKLTFGPAKALKDSLNS